MSARECTCTPCHTCRGRGWFDVDMNGRYVEYGDDLTDHETCDECGGSGTVDECAACCDERDYFEDSRA